MQSEYRWKDVSKEEFQNFVKNYPRPLIRDFYMNWHSWNDFEDGKNWPESMVARLQKTYDQEKYQIKECCE